MKRAGKLARFYLLQETRMLEWYKRTCRYYAVVNELNSLTDRELADIGINRYEIHYLAVQAMSDSKI
jgi:uncharacterized protein YjiS (DUF1127 family)